MSDLSAAAGAAGTSGQAAGEIPWVLKRARELLAEGDPRSVRGVVQDAIAVHGRQADLLWALADAEFADGDLITGRKYLDDAVAAGRGDPTSVARQIRGLRLGGFWREALSIVQGLSPELRADPQVRAEAGDFYRDCECPAHAADAYAPPGGLSRASRRMRLWCWLRSGGPAWWLRRLARDAEVKALLELSSPPGYIAGICAVEGLDDSQAQRVRVQLETYTYRYQRGWYRWRALHQAGYRLIPMCIVPVWLVLLAATSLGGFQPGPLGTAGFAAVSAVIAAAVVVAVTWVILRPDGTYRIQYSMAIGVVGLFAIVVFEAAAGAGFSQHQLPVGGWWAAVALGVTAGPAAVTCLLPAAVVIVAVPYGRRNRQLIRADPQVAAIDSLLLVLHDLRSPRAHSGMALRLYYCRHLEFAARCLTRYLLPPARVSRLGAGNWLAHRAAGWAEAIRFAERQIVAALPDRHNKTESLIAHEIQCLATGNLGALAWRSPPPAPSRSAKRRRAVVAVTRAAVAAALPLAAVFAIQPFIHASSSLLGWAKILTGAWALLYVLLSIDPTLRDKIGAARELADLVQTVPGPSRSGIPPQYPRDPHS